jgi:hypothetical protein
MFAWRSEATRSRSIGRPSAYSTGSGRPRSSFSAVVMR